MQKPEQLGEPELLPTILVKPLFLAWISSVYPFQLRNGLPGETSLLLESLGRVITPGAQIHFMGTNSYLRSLSLLLCMIVLK